MIVDDQWRGLSPADLDREYSPSSMLAGPLQPILDEWAVRTAALRAEVPPTELAYGSGPDERIDLYVPALADSSRPLHVYLHGGYWQAHGRADSAFHVRPLLDRGGPVAVVEYTIAPSATVETMVDQCVRAVEHLAARVAAGSVPARGVVVSGSSAGGHLAAMVLTRSTAADAAVLLSGVFDLVPLVHTDVNDPLHLDEAEAARLSPIRLVPQRRVPIVVAVGAVETSEFRRQSRAFADAWAPHADIRFVDVAHRDHFDLPGDLGDVTTDLGRAVQEHCEPR